MCARRSGSSARRPAFGWFPFGGGIRRCLGASAEAALNRVAGGFGVVAAPGRRGPPEGAVGELIDAPPRLLLEPVVMPALRARVTQARPPARLIRRFG